MRQARHSRSPAVSAFILAVLFLGGFANLIVAKIANGTALQLGSRGNRSGEGQRDRLTQLDLWCRSKLRAVEGDSDGAASQDTRVIGPRTQKWPGGHGHTVLMVVAVLAALIGNGFVPPSSFAAGCISQTAPGKFPFRGDPTLKTALPMNIGIVPDGFVALRDAATVPGIDVSKWQDATDFVDLQRCANEGGHRATQRGPHPIPPFVYIRMTAGEDPDRELQYATHWANARHENLFVGPYHYLDIIDAKTAARGLASEQFNELLRANLVSAEKQATTFIDRFARLLTLDPSSDVAEGDLGKTYLPIALDLSGKPQSKYSTDDTKKIGIILGAAACRWIERIRSDPTFADQPVIVFTTGYIFRDYGLASAPCDLRAGNVWISQHTANGDRPDLDPDPAAREVAKQLCIDQTGKNVCVIQQYTSYGGFALFRRDSGLDLDRFFGTDADLQAMLQHAKHPERWGTK